jgi:hypothetical protein
VCALGEGRIGVDGCVLLGWKRCRCNSTTSMYCKGAKSIAIGIVFAGSNCWLTMAGSKSQRPFHRVSFPNAQVKLTSADLFCLRKVQSN